VFADSEIWSEGLVPHEEWATAVQGKRRVFLQIGLSLLKISSGVASVHRSGNLVHAC